MDEKSEIKKGKETKNTQVTEKKKGDSIKLEEEDKIEFVRGEGRPENFLGLQNMSSGLQDNVKYGCTEELEDALSSVHPMGSNVQNRQQMTGSQDLEDMVKGYLKSGRVLEGKL